MAELYAMKDETKPGAYPLPSFRSPRLPFPLPRRYAMKEKLLLAGIVVCPTLEELYAALNSAKARGTRLGHGQPRSSSRSHPASPATGAATRPHLAPDRDAAGPPLHRRRPCQEGLAHDAEDAAAALRGARHVPPHRQRPERQATRGVEPRVRLGPVSNTIWRLAHARSPAALSLRRSSLYSYARVKCHGYIVSIYGAPSRVTPHIRHPTFPHSPACRCHGYKHKTHPPVKRSGRTASFGSQVTGRHCRHHRLLLLSHHHIHLTSFGSQSSMELYQFNDVELDEPVDVAVRPLRRRLEHTGSDAQRSLPLPLLTTPPAPLPLQVYEEAFGSDTLLGEVTIEIARLATVKQKVAEWHGTSRDSDSSRGPAQPTSSPRSSLSTDLRRGGRSAGEVCVELQLAPMPSARNRSTSGESEYEDGAEVHGAQLLHSHRAILLFTPRNSPPFTGGGGDERRVGRLLLAPRARVGGRRRGDAVRVDANRALRRR